MEQFEEGLRCQDINLGLRELDPHSSRLRLVQNTQTVGMAADLAGLIRGLNVLENIEALRIVAAETLDIGPRVFDETLSTLEQSGMVEVDRVGSEIARVTETIPVFSDLYQELGGAWRSRGPRQIEEELVSVVHRIARSPIPLESLESECGVEKKDVDELYTLGIDTGIFRTIGTLDGAVLYSPYTAFENSEAFVVVLKEHGPEQLAAALDAVGKYQGLPVDPESDLVLQDAVARGLIPAPAVEIPGGVSRSFATLPYVVGKELTGTDKPILDKALAIVACVRCGQHFGGATNASSAVAVLEALLSRDSLRPHESHARQYKLLRDLGVIRFLPDTRPDGSWVRPALIGTDENRRAVAIAIELVKGGDLMEGRQPSSKVQSLLGLDAKSLKPLQAAARASRRAIPAASDLARAFEVLMGRGAR